MKVVFLDIDGVLHPADQRRRQFVKQCMDRLQAILQGSGAQVVLSSRSTGNKLDTPSSV